MKVVLNLGENPLWLRKSRNLALSLKRILEALVEVNQHYLREHPGVPLLYQSGVRYKEEPARHAVLVMASNGFEGRVEEFASIQAVLERGWGDCDDLAPWRCAELRERFKQRAHIRVDWRRTKSGRLFHIVVRKPDPLTGLVSEESPVEDPSAKLGMYERSPQ
jgi:hypothetical protein